MARTSTMQGDTVTQRAGMKRGMGGGQGGRATAARAIELTCRLVEMCYFARIKQGQLHQPARLELVS
jgi:hypothetical protein